MTVCLNVLISRHFLFRPVYDQAKLRVFFFNFGWAVKKDEDNRKPSLGRLKGGRDR